jgi:hypothetical protein
MCFLEALIPLTVCLWVLRDLDIDLTSGDEFSGVRIRVDESLTGSSELGGDFEAR